MNRVEHLIEEMCPDGVPFKSLGEIGSFSRGGGFQKSDLTAAGIPAIHYGEIHTRYGVATQSTRSFLHESHRPLKLAKPGSLIIATTSEDDEAVAKATAWTGNGNVAVSGDALYFEHNLDPTFASYLFQSTHFRSQFTPHITGAKVRRISPKALSSLKAPIPPIRVQRKIVEILDKFSTLETGLETELEAELEARNVQVTYQTRHIFDRLHETTGNLVKLRDIGVWFGGGTPQKSKAEFWENGTIPWVSPKDMGRVLIESSIDRITELAVSNSSTKLVPPNSILIVTRSSILDHTLPVSYSPIELSLNQDIKAIRPHSQYFPKFVFYALLSRREQILNGCRRNGGSVTSIVTEQLKNFEIPIPSMAEQRHVATMLDSLHDLVSEQICCLPAEIAARRQQYEYYRDRLLTFKELQ